MGRRLVHRSEQLTMSRPLLLTPGLTNSVKVPASLSSQANQVETVETSTDRNPRCDVVVAGAVAVDYACDYAPISQSGGTTPAMSTSNPANISTSIGGVGHNVAMTAHLLGAKVKFFTVIGDDMAGSMILNAVNHKKLDGSFSRVPSTSLSSHRYRTAQYIAVNDSHKDLVVAMADVGILEQDIPDMDNLRKSWKTSLQQASPKYLVVDANWSAEMLYFWLKAGKQVGAKTVFEPVSAPKSQRLFPQQAGPHLIKSYPQHNVDISTPNEKELSAMFHAYHESSYRNESLWSQIAKLQRDPDVQEALVQCSSPELVADGIPQQVMHMLPYIPCLAITLGPNGVLLAIILDPDDHDSQSLLASGYILSHKFPLNDCTRAVYMRHFPPDSPMPVEKIVSVNGVGDTFLGAFIAQLCSGSVKSIEQAVSFAQSAAGLALQSPSAVCEEITSLKHDI
jgi:pseudouridylate synthase / pseudouridine kinase